MSYKSWTSTEELQLKLLYQQGKSDKQIAAILGRPSEQCIKTRRIKLGMKKKTICQLRHIKAKKWNCHEEEFIRNYYRQKSDEWMANKLKVTVSEYGSKRRSMGLSKSYVAGRYSNGERRGWTYMEDEFLRTWYSDYSAALIASYIGKKVGCVRRRAFVLGLKSSTGTHRKKTDHINGVSKGNWWEDTLRLL